MPWAAIIKAVIAAVLGAVAAAVTDWRRDSDMKKLGYTKSQLDAAKKTRGSFHEAQRIKDRIGSLPDSDVDEWLRPVGR